MQQPVECGAVKPAGNVSRQAGTPLQKVPDPCADYLHMCLQREVPRVEQVHFGIGDIPPECRSARRQEERVVLAPNSKERRLKLAEVFLELRVELDVAGIVQEEIELEPSRATDMRSMTLIAWVCR